MTLGMDLAMMSNKVMISGNVALRAFEHGSNNDVWWKGGWGKGVGGAGVCKVKSKPSLHGAVVPKLERYEKRCNGFDVLEGFTMEGRSHQNVSKLQMFLVTLFAF